MTLRSAFIVLTLLVATHCVATQAADTRRGAELGYTCHGCHGIENYRNAFPVWPGEWDFESIVSRVANAHELRNRVAHLEPLHCYDLRRARRDMRSVCHAIGPDAARFFVQTERLLAIIESNPLTRPRSVE